MASESIRFNKGGLSKKNRGALTIPEESSATQAAVRKECTMAENHKEHRDMQS